MKKERIFPMILVVIMLVVVLFALATCRKQEQIEEEGPTKQAEVQTAVQPESSPVEPETLTDQPTKEPTDEPTAEAEADVEPTPTAAPFTEVNDMEEYVSVTEFFKVMVPAGWSSKETFPGGAFIMANSEAALERFNSDRAIESGDLVLNIGFLPYELFRQREVVPLDIQFEATPDVFLQSFLPMFRIADNAVVSEPELVSLSDERDAGQLIAADEGREGMILMFAAGDEVIAFVSAVGFPGELDAFQEITYAVADGVVFSGAQEALYGTLLGG